MPFEFRLKTTGEETLAKRPARPDGYDVATQEMAQKYPLYLEAMEVLAADFAVYSRVITLSRYW